MLDRLGIYVDLACCLLEDRHKNDELSLTQDDLYQCLKQCLNIWVTLSGAPYVGHLKHLILIISTV